jgi:hypothetical protein
VKVKQGKKEKKGKKVKGGEREKKMKVKRRFKRPIVTFLYSPSKDVRLWWLQIVTFFFLT